MHEPTAVCPSTSAILEGMPDGFVALDPDGRWVAINVAAERLFGCARAATQGHANDDLLRDVLGTDIGLQLQRTRAAGEVVEFESFDRHRGRWLFIRLHPGSDGTATIFIQDITRQKRAESNLAFLLAISDDLANCNDEAGMMRSVCEKIGAHLGLSHCGFSEINEVVNEAVVTHDWHRSDVHGLVGVSRISDLIDDSFLLATRAGETFVVCDTQTDPRTDPARFAVLRIGAFVHVPVARSGDGPFLLTVCHSSAYAWRQDELDLLRALTERICTRLGRLRAEAQALASEQQYRTLLNSMDEGFCIVEMLFDDAGQPVEHCIVEANPAFERHTGVTDPVCKTGNEMVPGVEQFFNDRYGRVAITGESDRFEFGSHAMGRWFDMHVSRVGDAASRKVAILFNDITQRKQVQLALQHRTGQFETLFNEAPIGVYLIDSAFRVREVNPAALPVFSGIDDLIGRDFNEVMRILWPQPRADEYLAHFHHTLTTGIPYFAPDLSEVRYDLGVTEYYAWQIHRIALPEGGFGVVCYFRDISENVLARATIEESEQRYRALFAATPMAVFVCDRDAVIQQYNPRAVELWGREPTLGVEKHCGSLKLWLPDGTLLPHASSPMADVLRTGIPAHNVEVLIERPDGSHLPVLASFAAVINTGGQITGAITSFIDISQRLRAEAALRETEQRLQFVMDSMPQKVFTANPDGSIGYLNPQWMQYTGLSADEVRDWGRAGFIHPDDLAQTFQLWQQGFDTGQPLQIENRFRNGAGDYRWHINRLQPLRDKSGNIELWVGSSTDIHEQKQIAQELRTSASLLSEADLRKDEFLAMLAHELRNPLAPISNALQVLRLSDGNPDTVNLACRIMQRQVAQMVRLVDELLDVSRIRRGTIDLQCERVDLAAVIQQAVETSRPVIELAEQQLTVTPPPQPVVLDADATRLVQVFGNLLNNASKYSGAGGRIALTVERDGSQAVVTVTDTGIGIPVDKLSSVFEMFSQAHPSLDRSRSGLGIGLTLVQRLVELHGGSVTAASDGPGKGSAFVVRLPVALDAAVPVSPPAFSAPAAAVTRRRVLVVDDNRDSANTLALFLELIGNETRVAHDGLEAIQVAEAFLPDLVLLDIGMPNLSGHQAARHIRLQPWGATMALVALSGWGQDEDRRESIDAGFNAHLVKPLDHAALEKILAALAVAAL